MTNCYQCNKEISVEDTKYIHPLCQICQMDFDFWFEAQIAGN